MATKTLSAKIDDLFQHGKWVEARKVLELERECAPKSHWVLTQLGVTFYEQRHYEDALRIFIDSLAIKDDCPLTLWNVAGALDALGRHTQAKQIYAWILHSKRTEKEDPCWESKKWTDSLKSDCVYRLGVCSRHLGENQEAERSFRRYVSLLVDGYNGIYSLQDVLAQKQKLDASKTATATNALQKIVRATRRQSRNGLTKNQRDDPPKFTARDLLLGRRLASKK